MSNATAGLAGLKAAMPDWWPVLLGAAVMYVPTFYDLFVGLWSTEGQAHGPIIFALALWLIYRQWPEELSNSGGRFSAVAGWAVLVLSLCSYILGRSQQIMLFELGSVVGMFAGVFLIKGGVGMIRIMWFPLFFLLFMIPLPGAIVITLTMPMKMAVSYVTEAILHWADYPIARSGVILQIGQYQLLVADACAGLQTLLTLESLGLFYLNVVRHISVFRNVVLAILIVPISFAANVIRVISLTLITYYFGDEAGQGFLHDFAGMVLFLSALMLIIGTDALLQLIFRIRSERNALRTRGD